MNKQKGFATIYIVLGAVILSMAAGFYLYYKDSQATIAGLVAQTAALTIQVEEDKLIIAQAQADSKQQQIINSVINKKFAKSRVQVEELAGKLRKKNNVTGKTRDIGKLAIQKPKLLGKIFTRGTKEAFRCIELASGAKLTADELAAERKSQINSLCPDLANPSYIPY